jgi:hypothetical protein
MSEQLPQSKMTPLPFFRVEFSVRQMALAEIHFFEEKLPLLLFCRNILPQIYILMLGCNFLVAMDMYLLEELSLC